MLRLFQKLFGIRSAPDYKVLLRQGAWIVDVRTPGEYKGGHIKGSVNIPLSQLTREAKLPDKQTPLIVCCASGLRSGSALRELRKLGFKQVYNGGAWQSLQCDLASVYE